MSRMAYTSAPKYRRVPTVTLISITLSYIILNLQAETLSAHGTVLDRLSSEDVLDDLNDLMNQIFTRRAESTPAIPYVYRQVETMIGNNFVRSFE